MNINIITKYIDYTVWIVIRSFSYNLIISNRNGYVHKEKVKLTSRWNLLNLSVALVACDLVECVEFKRFKVAPKKEDFSPYLWHESFA